MPVTGASNYAVVTIDDVVIANKLVHAIDKTGSKFQVSFRESPAGILLVPQQGDKWLIERRGNIWYIVSKLDSVAQQEWIVNHEARSGFDHNITPGDLRVQGGTIFLESTELLWNGQPIAGGPVNNQGLWYALREGTGMNYDDPDTAMQLPFTTTMGTNDTDNLYYTGAVDNAITIVQEGLYLVEGAFNNVAGIPDLLVWMSNDQTDDLLLNEAQGAEAVFPFLTDGALPWMDEFDSTPAFTTLDLTNAPLDDGTIAVFLNGLMVREDLWTLSSNIITFTPDPMAAGHAAVYYHYTTGGAGRPNTIQCKALLMLRTEDVPCNVFVLCESANSFDPDAADHSMLVMRIGDYSEVEGFD